MTTRLASVASSLRSASMQALEAQAPEFRLVASLVQERFLGHSDAGVHGAAEWLLAKLGAQACLSAADSTVASTRKSSPGRWFVTGEGHTMVIIDARHDTRIKRVFAIAATETTIAQMLRFDPAHWYNKENSSGPNCPIGVVTWPRAIDYCEWLNKREMMDGSQSCYARGNERLPYTQVSPDLTRTGYRLPTRGMGIRLPRGDRHPEILRQRQQRRSPSSLRLAHSKGRGAPARASRQVDAQR